jgi:hypothetical protein
VRVTFVLGRLRVVRVVDPSSLSGSRVLGGRKLGFRLDVTDESDGLVGVSPGLMSVVKGGLVLVIVPVVVGVADPDPVEDEKAGST